MLNKILLPVDGSQFALEAVPLAARVLAMDGEVVLATVIDTPETFERRLRLQRAVGVEGDLEGNYPPPPTEAAVQQGIDAQRTDAEQIFAAAAARLREHRVAKHSTLVLSGEPGPALLAAAADHGCDAVLMTSQGRTGIELAVLGSVADYVIRNIRGIPLILFRPERAPGQ
jgi:nucleotide-binding universal stress UspA family protein